MCSEGEDSVSPVYLARNVVVYTCKSSGGDVASLVDLHFTRALGNTADFSSDSKGSHCNFV